MTTPRPQDTDPLRDEDTDRELVGIVVLSKRDYEALMSMGFRKDADGRYLSSDEPYPGWSSPPGPLSRLVAWVRKWRRG